MGFHSALVDRARRLEKSPATVVGGTVRFLDSQGEWFRCRLTLPGAPENLEGQTFRRTVIRVPTLMFDSKDAAGGLVRLSVEDRLEVATDGLGTEFWDVVSHPEPLRRKRRVLGWQATLRRVEDFQFTEAAS